MNLKDEIRKYLNRIDPCGASECRMCKEHEDSLVNLFERAMDECIGEDEDDYQEDYSQFKRVRRRNELREEQRQKKERMVNGKD